EARSAERREPLRRRRGSAAPLTRRRRSSDASTATNVSARRARAPSVSEAKRGTSVRSEARDKCKFATFDCYGTLIDWNAGVASVIGDELLARYHELEPQVQAEDPTRSYRDVMTETMRRLGADEPEELARSLPRWRAFPEVKPALERVRRRGWKLAILSNTDRDFIEETMRTIGVPFELAIVASEIGSYEPARAHWTAFERQT